MNRLCTAAGLLSAIAASTAYAQQGTAQPEKQHNAAGWLLQDREPINNATPRGTAVGNAFTYQGSLNEAGTAANGSFDIRFTLYDDLGTIVAGPICRDNVTVTDGVFTVQLDFGDQFFGDARELQLAVRPGGAAGNCDTGAYTTLSPRQEITATPYALGLRLPYSGEQSDSNSILAINNTDTNGLAAIHGSLGGAIPFSFADTAALRGDGSGTSSAGVLGVSELYAGLVGYSDGENAFGVVARADGVGGTGIFALALETDSHAGYFVGSTYFSSTVGIGTETPTTALDVIGTTRTSGLQVTTGAATGRVLKSDASGNATWQVANSTSFISSNAPAPSATTQFLSATATVTITTGQSILVTANRAFGTSAAAGADSLDLYVGYRVSGSGATPSLVGGGMLNMRLPQYSRVPFGISAIIIGLPAGTYEVGMAGDDDGNGNWNSNEFGYTSVLVLN